jgi:membrane-associated HD superfamily phosphohydrolase
MDIVVNGRTVTVNVKLPDLKDLGKKQGQGTDFSAMLEEQNSIKNEILEKGFTTYVKDMQQEKLEEEIREKILAALGLSEEDLANLPAKQRAAIEQTIQETIAQEIKAKAEEHNKEKGNKNGVSVPLIAGLSV